METLLIIYIFGGLLLVALSIPLLAKKIRPNPWYGFRISQTLENEDLWYKVNAYAARRLFAAGIVTIIDAIAFYLVPDISVDAYALACLAVFVLTFGIGILQSFRYLKKLEQEGDDHAGQQGG